MKTINELLNKEKVSNNTINSGELKIVKCPKCGKRVFMPAYMNDYVCHCAVRTEFNLDKLNDNMARTGIRRTRTRDLVFKAVPHRRKSKNKVSDEI